jgi:hypothetical protein
MLCTFIVVVQHLLPYREDNKINTLFKSLALRERDLG